MRGTRTVQLGITNEPSAAKLQENLKEHIRNVQSDSGDEYAFNVHIIGGSVEQIELFLAENPVNMIIDSGATTSINIIDEALWQHLKRRKLKARLRKHPKYCKPYDSSEPLPLLGKFRQM